MRNNFEDVLSRRPRLSSATHSTVRAVLNGAYTIASDGPTFHFLDANGANRTVFLPPRHTGGGQLYIIAGLSVGFNLDVKDSTGAAVLTVGPNTDVIFYSSTLTWRTIQQGGGTAAQLFLEPVIITGSSAAVSSGDSGVIINRVAPVTTAISLPVVSTRGGFPVRVVDWSSGIIAQHTITVTPSGAETIMRQPNWTLVSNVGGGLASATFWPSTTLNGWYMA